MAQLDAIFSLSEHVSKIAGKLIVDLHANDVIPVVLPILVGPKNDACPVLIPRNHRAPGKVVFGARRDDDELGIDGVDERLGACGLAAVVRCLENVRLESPVMCLLSPPPKVKVGEKVRLNPNGREYIGVAEAIWPPEQ